MEEDMKIIWEDYIYLFITVSKIKYELSNVLLPLDKVLHKAPIKQGSCNSVDAEPCPPWEAAKPDQVCCLHLQDLKTAHSKINPDLTRVSKVLRDTNKNVLDLLELYLTYMSFLKTKDPRLLPQAESPYSKGHELFKTKVELRRAREELLQMDEMLAARDKEIASRREELSSRVQTILKKDQELKGLKKKVSDLDYAVRYKNEELAKKEKLMSKKEQVILVKEQELRQKRDELENMDWQLRRSELLLQSKNLELSRKNKEIGRLSEYLRSLGHELPTSKNSASGPTAPVDVSCNPRALPRTSSPPRSPPKSTAALDVQQRASSPRLPPLSSWPPLVALGSSPGAVSSSTPVSQRPGRALDVDSDLVCKVCVQEEATALFHPCRHLLCGPKCAQKFCGKGCPFCRARVESWIHVFRA